MFVRDVQAERDWYALAAKKAIDTIAMVEKGDSLHPRFIAATNIDTVQTSLKMVMMYNDMLDRAVNELIW